MALRHSKTTVFVLGLGMATVLAGAAEAHPQHGYGPHGYRHHPHAYSGPSVILAPPPVYYAPPPPPVYYAPPPVYYAPPPAYYVSAPYPRYGYHARPGVSLNLRF